MPISETVIGAISKAVFAYLLQQSGLGDQVRRLLGQDPQQKAFQNALQKALLQLEQQHPDWTADFFNERFFQNEGAPTLAQVLLRDGHPNPSALASRWADSLKLQEVIGPVRFGRTNHLFEFIVTGEALLGMEFFEKIGAMVTFNCKSGHILIEGELSPARS